MPLYVWGNSYFLQPQFFQLLLPAVDVKTTSCATTITVELHLLLSVSSCLSLNSHTEQRRKKQ